VLRKFQTVADADGAMALPELRSAGCSEAAGGFGRLEEVDLRPSIRPETIEPGLSEKLSEIGRTMACNCVT